jgi:arylsulfatase
MFGHRAIWAEGWKAVSYHVRDADYGDDVWELYNLAEDFSECNDLAEKEPERLQKMIQLWWDEAHRYDVLPLDDRGFAERRAASKGRQSAPRERRHFIFRPGQQHIPGGATPFVIDRSYRIDAEIEAGRGDSGVVVACGGVCGGYSLYLKDGEIVHDYNYYGEMFRVRGQIQEQRARHQVSYEFTKTGLLCGVGRLRVDGRVVDEVEIPATYRYFIAWEGLDIGLDRMAPASTAYVAPFPFTGSIEQVVFDLAEDNDSVGDYEPAD